MPWKIVEKGTLELLRLRGRVDSSVTVLMPERFSQLTNGRIRGILA